MIFDFFSKWERGPQMNLKSQAVPPPLCLEQRKQKKTSCGSEFINFMTNHLFEPKMALNSLTSLTSEQNSDYFSLFFSLSLFLGEFRIQGCGRSPKMAILKIHFCHQISIQLSPLRSKTSISTFISP